MAFFDPPSYLRPAWMQTLLPAIPFGVKRKHPVLASAEDIILQVDGIRIHAALSRGTRRAIVILIHGWEGHIEAPYMLRTSQALSDHGFYVARLHLRDHGATHHLNEELFNGSMLDEHFEAVRQIAKMFPGFSVYLGGFSLGGNFALRIAARNSRVKTPIVNLKAVAAISPPLDPHRSTASMDEHRMLGRYLLWQWWRSLRTKEKLFPEKYNFSNLRKERSILNLTEQLILAHSPFESLEEYFGTYTLGSEFFSKIKVPVSILTAEDDPIIPPEEYCRLRVGPNVRIQMEKHGGHVGFLRSLRYDCAYVEFLVNAYEEQEDILREGLRSKESKKSVKVRRKVAKTVDGSRRKPRTARKKNR